MLSIVMMSRMSLTGHVFIGLGDFIVGLLLGLGALSVTGGTLLPLVQALLGRNSRRLAGGLVLTGVLVGLACSVGGLWPYSGTLLLLDLGMMSARHDWQAGRVACCVCCDGWPVCVHGAGQGYFWQACSKPMYEQLWKPVLAFLTVICPFRLVGGLDTSVLRRGNDARLASVEPAGCLCGCACTWHISRSCVLWRPCPATATMPKRLMLAQLHRTEAAAVHEGEAPAMRIANSSWIIGGADSNPASWLVEALGFDPKQAQVSCTIPCTTDVSMIQGMQLPSLCAQHWY